MFIPDKSARTVRLSVRVQDGRCTLASGNPLPNLKNGASAELVVYAADIVDENERQRLISERSVPFLAKGTTLWARVKKDLIPELLSRHRRETPIYPAMPECVVSFDLKEDLHLLVRAAKGAVLLDCKCQIPSLNLEAGSVNEAYTRISTAFEPSRRSHSGNVFNCVFFEKSDKLYPLKDLRVAREQESHVTQAAAVGI